MKVKYVIKNFGPECFILLIFFIIAFMIVIYCAVPNEDKDAISNLMLAIITLILVSWTIYITFNNPEIERLKEKITNKYLIELKTISYILSRENTHIKNMSPALELQIYRMHLIKINFPDIFIKSKDLATIHPAVDSGNFDREYWQLVLLLILTYMNGYIVNIDNISDHKHNNFLQNFYNCLCNFYNFILFVNILGGYDEDIEVDRTKNEDFFIREFSGFLKKSAGLLNNKKII